MPVEHCQLYSNDDVGGTPKLGPAFQAIVYRGTKPVIRLMNDQIQWQPRRPRAGEFRRPVGTAIVRQYHVQSAARSVCRVLPVFEDRLEIRLFVQCGEYQKYSHPGKTPSDCRTLSERLSILFLSRGRRTKPRFLLLLNRPCKIIPRQLKIGLEGHGFAGRRDGFIPLP